FSLLCGLGHRALHPLPTRRSSDLKSARHFIKRVSPGKAQPSLQLQTLNKYTNAEEIPGFLDPIIHGHDIGLLSEAGCPGIADPGAEVVRIAHQKRIQVVPLVGSTSIFMSLML